jgi:FMN reductase
VVGSPVSRASDAGAVERLFDLVDPRRLGGKPVVLVSTSLRQRRGRVGEHPLRPLFRLLDAPILPTTIHAAASDFADNRISSARIRGGVERVAEEALEHLDARKVTPTRGGVQLGKVRECYKTMV